MTVEQKSNTSGKSDQGKVRTDLVIPDFILGVAEVRTFGTKKYGPDTWKDIPDAVNRYYAATLRHLLAWRNGDTVDAESGLNHLKHVACNIMFLQELTKGK
jgi:hypothetical protein